MSWSKVPLGEIAEIAAGGGAPQNPDDFGDKGHPFVRAGSLKRLVTGGSVTVLEHMLPPTAAKHRLRLFPLDTVLFAKSGMSASIGLVHHLSWPAYVVNHLAAVICGDRLDSRFLHQYLRAFSPARLIQDAAYPSIRLGEIANLKIPLPPITEQRRIAAILDKADTLRAKRREVLAQLDCLAQSIFVEMFGNPVKNSKGWPFRSFNEVCPTRLGKMLDQKQQTGQHSRKYLRNANVQWFRFDLSDLLEMDFDEAARETFALKEGDLLICEGGEPGRAAIWRNQLSDCYYQKALHRGRPDPSLAQTEYLLWLLWCLAKGGGLSDHVTSATIAHLTGEKLKAMRIPLPPLLLQCQFAERLRVHEQLRLTAERALTTQEALFASLQHRAFRGEL